MNKEPLADVCRQSTFVLSDVFSIDFFLVNELSLGFAFSHFHIYFSDSLNCKEPLTDVLPLLGKTSLKR